jgi:uncharacterized protein
MGTEVRPLGVKCNITCLYCYQNPIRDAANRVPPYDIDAIEKAILQSGTEFTLFGGEPLLVPIEDLSRLWKLGFDRFGKNGIQTNGTLITDAHIELFRKFNVHVGLSIDGPGELNDLRWSHSLARTRSLTDNTISAIQLLRAAGISTSIIITLSRCNASKERLPRLIEWVRWLDGIGITSARLHTLEIDHPAIGKDYALTSPEYIEVYSTFDVLEKTLRGLRFDVLRDMRNMLLGNDRHVTCVWGACDPMATRAVQGIEGRGQTSNCGRTNKEGIEFIKADRSGFERQVALYNTKHSDGGCQGCRFFLMCKGQCPGTAINGDWRNRSEECELWYGLFEKLEAEMVCSGQTPLSKDDVLRPRIEGYMLDEWSAGRNPNIQDVRKRLQESDQAGRSSRSPQGEALAAPNPANLDKRVGEVTPTVVAVPGASTRPTHVVDAVHEDAPAHHADGMSHHIPATPEHGDHIDNATTTAIPAASRAQVRTGVSSHVDHADSHRDHSDSRSHGDFGDVHGDSHGDHTDASKPSPYSGDREHGDHADHGDSHRDHTDLASAPVSSAPSGRVEEASQRQHGDGHGDHSDDAGKLDPGREGSLQVAHGDGPHRNTISQAKPQYLRHYDEHGDHSDWVTGSSIL